jgi:hypothetical protein
MRAEDLGVQQLPVRASRANMDHRPLEELAPTVLRLVVRARRPGFQSRHVYPVPELEPERPLIPGLDQRRLRLLYQERQKSV